MKKYIFITPVLSNMGGAQMYVRNKLLFLQQHGWDVKLITAEANNVIITELRNYDAVIPELGYNMFYYTRRKKRKVYEQILPIVEDETSEEIVLESTSIVTSVWAEQIAKDIRAKHIILLLQEHNIVSNLRVQDYLRFKHSRREIAGITPQSLVEMFASFSPIKDIQSYCLEAFCSNVEADVDCTLLHNIDKSRYDYIVGALSRMDKPFVLRAIEDFAQYASNNFEKKFLFLWIGDAPSENTTPQEARKVLEGVYNVDFVITGYMMPVPTRLLDICDIFISSSGSSLVCMRSGVPTIVYDGNDLKPIGILGRTTDSPLFRNANEKPLKLEDLMNKVLVDKMYTKIPSDYQKGLPDFKSHIDFLATTDKRKEYYDVNGLRIESYREIKVALGLLVLGPYLYTWLHNHISCSKKLLLR